RRRPTQRPCRSACAALALVWPSLTARRSLVLPPRPRRLRPLEELVRAQPEPLDSRLDARPLLVEELLALALQEPRTRAADHQHPEPATRFDEPVVHELLIPLEDREWIHAIFTRNRPHRRQRLAFLEDAVENHRDNAIAQLAINRLTVVPLTIHQ